MQTNLNYKFKYTPCISEATIPSSHASRLRSSLSSGKILTFFGGNSLYTSSGELGIELSEVWSELSVDFGSILSLVDGEISESETFCSRLANLFLVKK